jgi:hypothetical protein
MSALLSEALGGLDVLDPEDQTVRVDSLWAERPAVLVFVRHFG